jgi:hypothetical protein
VQKKVEIHEEYKKQEKMMKIMMNLAQMRIFRRTHSMNRIRVQPCIHTLEKEIFAKTEPEGAKEVNLFFFSHLLNFSIGTIPCRL